MIKVYSSVKQSLPSISCSKLPWLMLSQSLHPLLWDNIWQLKGLYILILLCFVHWLMRYNTWQSQGLICHLVLILFANLCMLQQRIIFMHLNVFYDTLKVEFIMVFSCNNSPLMNFLLILILTGLVVLTHVNLPLVMQSFLVPI